MNIFSARLMILIFGVSLSACAPSGGSTSRDEGAPAPKPTPVPSATPRPNVESQLDRMVLLGLAKTVGATLDSYEIDLGEISYEERLAVGGLALQSSIDALEIRDENGRALSTDAFMKLYWLLFEGDGFPIPLSKI